jgi:hypothetical protein
MKVIGIEIDGARANFIGLDSNSGDILEVSSIPRFLELEDDKDFDEVRRFRNLLHNVFSAVSPDVIGIYSKPASGRHAAGPITYKVEGLIQLYEGKSMKFVHHKSIAALKNKKEYEAKCKFAYQQQAADVAYYLIHNDE